MLANLHDWRLVSSRPGKRVYSRYDAATDEIVFMEEWDDEAALQQAEDQRNGVGLIGKNDMKALAVIPDSVRAQALREGWYFDDKAWKRWMNDVDNNKLRVSGGRA